MSETTNSGNEQVKSETAEQTQIQASTSQIPRSAVIQGGSINLIPKLTETEEQIVETKQSVDLRAVIFLLFIAILGIAFVIYTNHVNNELEFEEQKLEGLENQLEAEARLIHDNNQVLNRYELFEYINDNFFSSKEVLVFWKEISGDLGDIDSIELEGDLEYEISGESETLLDVAKFWHLLSLDIRVAEVHLESLTVPQDNDDMANFNFTGILDITHFDQDWGYE